MHLTLQSVYPAMIIIFFLYKKIKRSIGYQPLKPRWLFTRIILFSLFAFGSFQSSAPFTLFYMDISFWAFLAEGSLSFSLRKTSPLKNAEERSIFGLIFG